MSSSFAPEQGWEALLFELGGRRFALPGRNVQEVVHAVELTPLPGAEEFVEGIFSLRGTIVPVIDLRPVFGMPPVSLHVDDEFVLVRVEGRLLAIRVDSTLDYARVPVPQALPAPNEPGHVSRLVGVVQDAGGVLFVQDLRGFLTSSQQACLDAALARHPWPRSHRESNSGD